MKTPLARTHRPQGAEVVGAGAPAEPRAGVGAAFGRFDDHLARARRRDATPTRGDESPRTHGRVGLDVPAALGRRNDVRAHGDADRVIASAHSDERGAASPRDDDDATAPRERTHMRDRDDEHRAAPEHAPTTDDPRHGDRGRVAFDDGADRREDDEPRRTGPRGHAERDDERDASSSSSTTALRTTDVPAPVPALLDVTAATLAAASPAVVEGDRDATAGVGDTSAADPGAAIAASTATPGHGPGATATTVASNDAAAGAATPAAGDATASRRLASSSDPAPASRDGEAAPSSSTAASDAAPSSLAAAPPESAAAPTPNATAVDALAAPALREPTPSGPASAPTSTDDTAVSTIERAEDLADAVDRLRPLPKGGATISVQTPALGRVALHVALDDGALRIRVVADDPAALEWFRSEHDGLLAAARQAVPTAEHVELELQTRHDAPADAMPERDAGQRDANHHGRPDREVAPSVHDAMASPQRSKGATLEPSAPVRRGGALVDVVA